MPPVPPPPVVVPKLAPGAAPPQRPVNSGDKARARGQPPAPTAQHSVHIPALSTPEADAAAAARAATEQAERDEAARMAAAIRTEQRALAEAEAQAAKAKAAADEEEKAAAARLNAYTEFQRGPARAMAALSGITLPAEDGDDDVFAEAEAAVGGGAVQPAAAEAPDGFNIHECLGTTGGVADSWSMNDALFEPIVYSVEYGYEYRVITQSAGGDFVVRRYFVADADQYSAFTIGLGRPMPNSHFTHCGSNFVLFGAATWVFYSPPALERALRINERLANQATPAQEIARLIAGTPGLDTRTMAAFAAQHAELTQPAPMVQNAPAPSSKSAPAPIRRK